MLCTKLGSGGEWALSRRRTTALTQGWRLLEKGCCYLDSGYCFETRLSPMHTHPGGIETDGEGPNRRDNDETVC